MVPRSLLPEFIRTDTGPRLPGMKNHYITGSGGITATGWYASLNHL